MAGILSQAQPRAILGEQIFPGWGVMPRSVLGGQGDMYSGYTPTKHATPGQMSPADRFMGGVASVASFPTRALFGLGMGIGSLLDQGRQAISDPRAVGMYPEGEAPDLLAGGTRPAPSEAGFMDVESMVPFGADVAGMATTGTFAAAPGVAGGVGMGVRSYRGNWRNDRPMTYNDSYFDIVPDKLLDDAGNVLAVKDRLIPNPNLIDRIPAEPQDGVIYRGMSAAEFDDFQKTGRIQSNGSYNIGEDQVGLTYFSTDPKSAQSYANSFAPVEHKPTYEKPAYVVAVRAPPADRTRRIQGTGEHEVGVVGEIPASDVVAVYRGNVVQHDPGVKEKNISIAPSSWLNWERLSSNPKESSPLGASILGGNEPTGAPFGIRAYHASPHDFDRFDLSHLGTGEGAQTYGVGHYFAESPAVSGRGGAYDQAFSSNPRYLEVGGQRVPVASNLRQNMTPKERAAYFAAKGDIDAAIRLHQGKVSEMERGITPTSFQKEAGWGNADLLRNTITELEKLKEAGAKPAPTSIYEVSINASPDEFLDWDKPLSEQSPAVRKAFSEAAMGKAKGDPILADLFGDEPIPNEYLGLFDKSSGAQAYNTIAAEAGGPDKLSERLRAAGIKGIRYKDAGSRIPDWKLLSPDETTSGKWRVNQGGYNGHNFDTEAEARAFLEKNKPTSNYVVFDDNIIDILKKYGIAGLMAGGAGAGILGGSSDTASAAQPSYKTGGRF